MSETSEPWSCRSDVVETRGIEPLTPALQTYVAGTARKPTAGQDDRRYAPAGSAVRDWPRLAAMKAAIMSTVERHAPRRRRSERLHPAAHRPHRSSPAQPRAVSHQVGPARPPNRGFATGGSRRGLDLEQCADDYRRAMHRCRNRSVRDLHVLHDRRGLWPGRDLQPQRPGPSVQLHLLHPRPARSLRHHLPWLRDILYGVRATRSRLARHREPAGLSISLRAAGRRPRARCPCGIATGPQLGASVPRCLHNPVNQRGDDWLFSTTLRPY